MVQSSSYKRSQYKLPLPRVEDNEETGHEQAESNGGRKNGEKRGRQERQIHFGLAWT